MRAEVIGLGERPVDRRRPAPAVRPRGSLLNDLKALDVWVALAVLSVIVSAVCRPSFPVGDPAVFEYIGRALGDGAHLYTDLWDNKLPSIYLVNALLWHVFGAHYAMHVFAESIVNAGSIALFGAIVRSFGLRRWGPAVLTFSLLYGFVGGPFDQTEHYAIPLTLAALLLAKKQRPAAAGLLAVIGATFWIPAIAIALPTLLCLTCSANRFKLLASMCGTAAVCAVLFVATYGEPTMTELARSWFSYQAGHFDRANPQEPHHYPIPWLSPRYYIQSGLGLLLGLIAASWTRRRSPARTFALCWSISGIVVVFALGKPSIHYFLAVYAPLVMLLATQPLDLAMLKRRWYFTAVAGLCALVMVGAAIAEHRTPFFGRPAAIQYTGDLVRRTFGPQAIGVMPWEIYLASDARPPNRFFLASGSVNFARVRDIWTRAPVVFIDAADQRFNRLAPPRDLPLECASPRTAPYVLWSAVPIPGLRCVRT